MLCSFDTVKVVQKHLSYSMFHGQLYQVVGELGLTSVSCVNSQCKMLLAVTYDKKDVNKKRMKPEILNAATC